MIRKGCVSGIIMLLIVLCSTTNAYADMPYRSYNYNYWELTVPSPSAYEPVGEIGGEEIGAGNFTAPGDMFITQEGKFYLLDSGNNRIVVFSKDLKLEKTISTFDNNGRKDSFNGPQGICVRENGRIYVADTDNNRVVILSNEGALLQIIQNPKSEIIADDFIFFPTRIGVDAAERIYVVAKNVFEGMMSFDSEGNFVGYFGTIKVQVNPTDWFWKSIATKEQKQKMVLFIPTEYRSLDIDDEGFVYATNVDYNSEQTISRLNPSGKNVLVKYNESSGAEKTINGDLRFRDFGMYSGPSRFVDVKRRDKGIYSALDATRGRIFTYDSEGNLIYIFGGLGNQFGLFKQPVALEVYEGFIYVLDQGRGKILSFKPTQYGGLINKAIGLRYDGAELEAVEHWKEVLKLDAHFELAYSGIGKSLMAANENAKAIEYLSAGMNKQYYSVAYKRYRNDIMKEYFDLVAGVLFAFLLFIFIRKILKKRVLGKRRVESD